MAGQDTPNEDFADAISRYLRSCDDMRMVMLNPRKAIPWDQWPEDTQLRGHGVIRLKDAKRYTRYLHRVIADNERIVAQAKEWWAWWERSQASPPEAGVEPLVDPKVLGPLRMAAHKRQVQGGRGSKPDSNPAAGDATGGDVAGVQPVPGQAKFEKLSDERARLTLGEKAVEVRGPLQSWMLQQAFEAGRDGVIWTELLKARRAWEGREALPIPGDLDALKRTGRTLAKKVNDAMGSRVLTTVDGLHLDLEAL